jgi:pimeloyl-ACP methyl ester carboxylesterase
MASKQHHFVLVHGGGHGAWCWMKVIPELEKAGNRATALDLFSAGDHPGNADDCLSFEHYIQPLVDLFKSFPENEKVNLAKCFVLNIITPL